MAVVVIVVGLAVVRFLHFRIDVADVRRGVMRVGFTNNRFIFDEYFGCYDKFGFRDQRFLVPRRTVLVFDVVAQNDVVEEIPQTRGPRAQEIRRQLHIER